MSSTIRRATLATVSVVAAALIAAGCGNEGGVLGFGGIPEDAICTVDGEPILQEDYDRRIELQKTNIETRGQEFPEEGSTEYEQFSNQLVDFLISQEMLRQAAEDQGVKVSDKEVEERLQETKEREFPVDGAAPAPEGEGEEESEDEGGEATFDEEAYEDALEQSGYTEEELRSDLRDQLEQEQLYEKVTDDVTISDAEAEEKYEETPEQWVQPEQRDIAHILVEEKAAADKIYEQVSGPNPDEDLFAKLAAEQSQDPSSAQEGGELTIARGQTVPPFDKTAFELETGEVSKPVKTQFGYHVIWAKGDVTPETTQEFEEVKEDIKEREVQSERTDRFTNWQENLRKDYEDEVECKDGYVWTQTVTETEETAPEPAPEPESDEESGEGEGEGEGEEAEGGAEGESGGDAEGDSADADAGDGDGDGGGDEES